jgi:metal-responsive CopG/Arc/MetJ family transcriptional regulator
MSTQKLVRATFYVPAELLDLVDEITTAGNVESRDEFFAQALQRELRWQKRQEIDAALVDMVQDPEYRILVEQMEVEFAGAVGLID